MDTSSNPTFITSKEAAALTGYVADYITRQCRAGKIKSKQEGRVWLIEKESLLNYFRDEEKRKEANAQALARAREEEYREAQKARGATDPVPSPYVPAPIPFEWIEAEGRPQVRGSFAALAVTLLVLSAGMYMGESSVRASVLSAVEEIGGRTVTFVGTGVYEMAGLKDDDRGMLAGTSFTLPHIAPLEIPTDALALKLEEVFGHAPEVPRNVTYTHESFKNNAPTLPSLVVDTGAEAGASLKYISDAVLGMYVGGVEAWVRVTPEIPPRVISFVGDIGYTLASLSNSTPTRVANSFGGFENFALGVVGHIALAYDTTKDTLARAYQVRITEPQESRRYVVESTQRAVDSEQEENRRQEEAGEYEQAGYSKTAAVAGSGALGVFEGLAVGTYEFINGLFGAAGDTLASLFAPKEAGVAVTQVLEPKEEETTVIPSAVKQTVDEVMGTESSTSSSVTPIYSGERIFNEYYTITSTGVSAQYVEERIKLHVDNLDDRVDERIDNVGGGGGGGSVTSVDISGGTTGLSFAGGPVTSTGTFTLSGMLAILNGGTGTSTAPNYGQMLLGNSSGGYDLVATSSLGISGGSSFSYLFPSNATTTSITFNGGLTTSAFTLGSLNGPLQANAGVVSATTSIGALYGGTGLTTAPTYGQMLVGNAGGGYTLTATSSLGLQGTLVGTQGQVAYFSGTNIAVGTSSLFIATSGNVGIGSTTPGFTLGVEGTAGMGTTTFMSGGVGRISIQPALASSANVQGALYIGNSLNTGLFTTGGNDLTLVRQAIASALISSGVHVQTGHRFGFSNGTASGLTFSGTIDSAFSRIGVGSVGLGNGTAGNTTGTFVTERIGLGTSTPYAQLSIVATSTNGVGAPTTLFAIASTTAGTATSTLFSVTNGGGVGINAASGVSALTISSSLNDTTRLTITPESTNRIAIDAGSGIDVRFAGRIFDFEYATDLNNGFGTAFGFGQSSNAWELTGSSVNQSMVSIAGEFAQTGTASADGLLVAPVFTSLGDGSAGGTGNNIFRAANGTDTKFVINTSGLVGIGTTSPYSKLSIHANNGETNATLFAIGSSTASATTTLLSVNNSGQLLLSDGSNTLPSLSFANETGLGLYRRTSNVIQVGRPSAATLEFVTSGTLNGINLGNGVELGWNSTGLGSGGMDTYLGRIAAGVLALGTGGNQGSLTGTFVTERIGLGTTTPYAQLSIVATSTNGVGAPTTLFAIASTTAGTATSTLFAVLNTGSVGLGTSSPISLLTLVPTVTGDGIRLDGNTSSSITAALNISLNSTAYTVLSTASAAGHGVSTTAIGDTVLKNTQANALIFGTTNTERMRITASGNVGIGTTTPAGTLTVLTSTGIQSTNGSTAALELLPQVSNNILKWYGSSNFTIANDTNFSNLGNGSAGNSFLTITTGGNVGIGSSTPNSKLVLTGNNDANKLTVENTGSGLGVMLGGRNTTSDLPYLQAYTVASGIASNFLINPSGGNVGIGSTSPYANLSVHANNGATNTTLFSIGSSTASATTSLLTVLNSGFVGIGTSSPGQLLNIYNEGTGSMLSLSLSSSVTGTNPGVAMGLVNRDTTDNNGNLINFSTFDTAGASVVGARFGARYVSHAPGATNGVLVFQTMNAGSIAERVRISSEGYLGIGTTSPWAQLSVNPNGLVAGAPSFVVGSSTATNFIVTQAGLVGIGTTSPVSTLHVNGVISGTDVASTYLIKRGYNNTGLYVESDGALSTFVGGNRALTAGTSGNVGIGTTSPGTKLDVFDSSQSTVEEMIRLSGIMSAVNAGKSIDFYHDAANAYARIAGVTNSVGGAGELSFYTNTGLGAAASTEKLRITGAGNVGIGTTSPASVFSVAGGGYFTGGIGVGVSNPGIYALNVHDFNAGAGSSINLSQSGNVNSQINLYKVVSGETVGGQLNNSSGFLNLIALGVARGITFVTNSSAERMRIDPVGNVGIGTTSPYSKLSVHANNGETNTRLFAIGSSTASATTTHFVVTNTGNVGIGTTSPGVVYAAGNSTLTLGVAAGSSNRGVLELSGDTGTSGTAGAIEYLNGTTRLGVTYVAADGAANSGYMGFATFSAGVFGERLRITSAGNVGIGTTSPQEIVSVESASSARFTVTSTLTNGSSEFLAKNGYGLQDGLSLRVFGSAFTTAGALIQDGGIVQARSGLTGGLAVGTEAAAPIVFFTNGSAAGEKMRILSDGNVGIGTTTPQRRLEVGSGSGAEYLRVNGGNGSSEGAALIFSNNSTDLSYIGNYSAIAGGAYNNALTLFTTGNNLLLSPSGGGNVGIASTSPWRTLSVTGTASFAGLSTGAGAGALCLSANNEVLYNAGASCTVSSGRFKNDIEDSELGLAAVLALRPVSYFYNDDVGVGGEQLGFIAEEVEGIDPRLVVLDTEGRPFTVKYDQMTAVLAKAIQELNLNVESLASTSPSTAEEGSFASRFFTNLISWLANSGNGIANVFVGSIDVQEQICVDGECLTKDDIRALLELVGTGAEASEEGSGGGDEEGGSGEQQEVPVEESPAEDPAADEPSAEELLAEEPSVEEEVTEGAPEDTAVQEQGEF